MTRRRDAGGADSDPTITVASIVMAAGPDPDDGRQLEKQFERMRQAAAGPVQGHARVNTVTGKSPPGGADEARAGNPGPGPTATVDWTVGARAQPEAVSRS